MWFFRSTVSQLFAPVSPTVWTRHVVCTAVRVHRVQAYCAFHDVFVFFDMVLAPLTQVVIDLWARPLLAMAGEVPGMKPTTTVCAMLRNDTGHLAGTECATDCGAWNVVFGFDGRFPLIIDQRSRNICGGTGHRPPRVRSSLIDRLSQSFHFSSNLQKCVDR